MKSKIFFMFINNLWVILMIRVVNLMIELPSTVNLCWKRQTSYELDTPRPVYILEKNQNVNRIGSHLIHICKWKCESDGPPSGLNFFPKCKPDRVSSGSHFHLEMWIGWGVIRFTFSFGNVNRITPIRFIIFFKM